MITEEQAVDILQSMLPKDLTRKHREEKHDALMLAIKAIGENSFAGHIKGEWLWEEDVEGYRCDRCGYEPPYNCGEEVEDWTFCPCCGAKMT